VFWHISWIFT